MPAPYVNEHWNVFSAIPHVAADSIGFAPALWAVTHQLDNPPANLPNSLLNRSEVRAICRSNEYSVLYGYICAMAWGSQGAGPAGSRHVTSALAQGALLVQHLEQLRQGGLSRSDAYNLFTGEGNILGLGPAYWTKLLYFFCPEPTFYILDQWTGKSINLLTGHKLVRLAGNAVSPNNKSGSYQAYCEEIDIMAGLLDLSGENVEEMLMSKGGQAPWPWRTHLKHHHDFNPTILHEIYPHIPEQEF